MDTERPAELVESWINGNLSFVAKEITEARDPAALAVAVCAVLIEIGHGDDIERLHRALVRAAKES